MSYCAYIALFFLVSFSFIAPFFLAAAVFKKRNGLIEVSDKFSFPPKEKKLDKIKKGPLTEGSVKWKDMHETSGRPLPQRPTKWPNPGDGY